MIANSLRDRAKLAELGRNAVTRMETWSPRENVETTVMAIEQAVQLQPRNVDHQ